MVAGIVVLDVGDEVVVCVVVSDLVAVMSVGVEVVVDVVGVEVVVVAGKEAHGGQTPSYTRKPL